MTTTTTTRTRTRRVSHGLSRTNDLDHGSVARSVP
jgi:hypothetical protein